MAASVSDILRASGLSASYGGGAQVAATAGTEGHEALSSRLRPWIGRDLGTPAHVVDPFTHVWEAVAPAGAVMLVERRLHAAVGFHGQPDLVQYDGRVYTVTDWKFGQRDPAHPLQLAGYALLVAEHYRLPDATAVERRVVYLPRFPAVVTAPVVPEVFRDAADFKVFYGAFVTVQWRLAHRRLSLRQRPEPRPY